MVGQSDSTTPPPSLPDRLGSRTQSIIYGWPTVVVTDRDYTVNVTPLFAVPIELERGSGNRRLLHATMEPEFNLAITASGIFDPSITEDIRDLLSHGLPFGDPDAFAELASPTAELLGLNILSELDAEFLQSSIDRQQGVYNAAVSVLAEWSAYTGTLREELRQLQERNDWKATAAAHLVPGKIRCGQASGVSLDVAEISGCEGALDGLEPLPNHRIVTHFEYLAAVGLDH